MASDRKHLQVHWSNGMQISKDHFIQMEDAMTHLAHSMGIHGLSSYNYGLLPVNFPTEKSYDLRMVSNRLELMACQALTPGGIPIQIPAYSGHQIECAVDVSGAAEKAWAVVLKVDPFERELINEAEARNGQIPLAIPQYQLLLREISGNMVPDAGPDELVVGRLVSNGTDVQRDESYFPPCVSLVSHEGLLSEHKWLVENIEKGINHAFTISKILNNEGAHDPQLAESIKPLIEGTLAFMTDLADQFRLMLKQQPPVHILYAVVKIARALDNVLKTLPRENNEELRILNYLSATGIVDIGEFKQSLQSLLKSEYYHNEMRITLGEMQSFVQLWVDKILAGLSNIPEYKWKKVDSGRMVFKVKRDHVE